MKMEDLAQAAEPEDKDDVETNEVSSEEDSKIATSKGMKRSTPASALDDDKKAERRAANRRSAFQSRQRRKILIDDLQRTVAALSKDNGDLRKTNDELRLQLEATLLENQQFRMQQQLAGAAGHSLLGVPGLQSTQVQAFLNGGGTQAALSRLLAAGPSPGLGGSHGTANGSSSDNSDPLAQARLALAATQTRSGDTLGQSLGSNGGSAHSVGNDTSAPTTATSAAGNTLQNGIQGILTAASLANAPGGAGLHGLASANSQLSGLQAILDRGGVAGLSPGAAHLSALQGLVEQLRYRAGPGGCSPEVRQALLQGQAGNQLESKNTISDTLRSLLHKSN